MQNQSIKTPLIVLDIQTQTTQEIAFISRYNQVINAYNKYSEEGCPKMQVMVGNSFIKKISYYLNKPLFIVIISLVMLLVPVVNFICLICIFSYIFYLRRENKKHVRNKNRVRDPFEQFFFAPDMCQTIGKHYATIDLEQHRKQYLIKEIQGFTFNQELRSKLSKKINEKGSGRQDHKLTVLIYDQYFFDSFHLYKKEFYKTLIWLMAGIFFVSISTILYLSILLTP